MKKYIYAISYFENFNVGCCVIKRTKKINSIEDFNQVKNAIACDCGTDKVVILNIMFIGKEKKG